MKNKRYKIILITVVVLLSIPLIAMQFSDEVSWGLFDFVVMGILLLSTGFLIEFAMRKISLKSYRIVVLILILLAFFLIWAELAVGIFGTPFAGS